MEMIYSVMENLLPFSWVNFTFMKNAFLAVILITPLLGLVGTMIVNNKMSFFSDALGHCALTGIALGVLLGISNTSIAMLGFSIIFALGISLIMHSEISSADTVIGVFSSAGIALGIFILSLSGGFAKYSAYLVGDILSITKSEIIMLFFSLIIVLVIWMMSFNSLLLSSLNTDLAQSKQINVKFYKGIFVILIAIIVTISLKWIGMLMINSLLVLPAASAKNIVRSMKAYHLASVAFSFVSGVSGLLISYYAGTSAGSTIVLVSTLIFFVTFFINRLRRMS